MAQGAGGSGGKSDTDIEALRDALIALGPFRKGPFSVYGQTVASHWNSDAKWQHVLPFLESDPAVCEGRVLDLGCNNGYYLFRLLELNERGTLVGIDPAPNFYRQFTFLRTMLGSEDRARRLHFYQGDHGLLKAEGDPNRRTDAGIPRVPGASEGPGPALTSSSGVNKQPEADLTSTADANHRPGADLTRTSGANKGPAADLTSTPDANKGPAADLTSTSGANKQPAGASTSTSDTSRPQFREQLPFDAILCWGVIYHQTDPIDLLRAIHTALTTGGVLYLESMGIPEDPSAPYPRALVPPGKFAGARGIWAVPDAATLQNYLHRSGFRDIEILKQWDYSAELNPETGLPALQDFLDPERPGFLKDGLPAPIRILVRARR